MNNREYHNPADDAFNISLYNLLKDEFNAG